MGEGLNPRLRADVDAIVRENWTVDGPFICTLNEVTDQITAELGVPQSFLTLLTFCIVYCARDIIRRKDDEELGRLVIRMYFSGLHQGVRWEREGRFRAPPGRGEAKGRTR